MIEKDRDLLAEVDELITRLEAHPDAEVRAQVTRLLEGIDIIHRSGLGHLVNAIRGMAGEPFLNRLIADPAIRMLLMSYDLVAVNRQIQAEEALDAVRGHLHAHGIDIELLGVLGGVVTVRLHGVDGSGVSETAARHDIQTALQEGLPGFQELEVEPLHQPAGAAGAPLVQLGGLAKARQPIYRSVLAVEALEPGTVRGVEVDDQPVLLANVAGEVCAVRNRCGESPLPLEYGEVAGNEITCPWHRCRYDLRTGERLDPDAPVGERIRVFPVTVRDGEILVAVATEPVSTT